MDDNCTVCASKFLPKGKSSYHRYSVKTLASPVTFNKVFPQSNISGSLQTAKVSGYLCADCLKELTVKTVPIKGKNGARSQKRRWVGSPRKTPSKKLPSMKTPTKTQRNLFTHSPSTKTPNQSIKTPSKETKRSLFGETSTTHTPPKSPSNRSSLPRTPSRTQRSLFEESTDVVPVTENTPFAIHPRTPKKKNHGTPKKNRPSPGFTSQAAALISRYEYAKAFRLLVAASPPAKRDLLKVVAEMIKNEKVAIKTSSTSFSQELTLNNIEAFSWKDSISEMEEVAPVTVGLVKDMFPCAKKIAGHRTVKAKAEKRGQTLDEAEETLSIRIGTALSLILFTNSPHKFKFLPSGISVELWRQGTTQKAFTTLNHMGVTLGSSAARGHVDRLRKHHNVELLVWKSEVEERAQNKQGNKSARVSLQKKLDVSGTLKHNASYSVCWDNVQIEAHAKHQGIEKQNTFLMWGMTFAVNHRVPTLHLAKDDNIDATDVPTDAFVADIHDLQQLRKHMEHVVVHVLSSNLDCLAHLKFEKEIPHEQSAAMNSKTDVVNLGVVEANPSSTDGCITIMEHLYQYVPVILGIALLILVSGDGLSVERMIHAHLARANGRTHEHRLDGLVECPQEFHKEILLLQDYMNLLFRGGSIGGRGTLAQLKEDFKHRSLSKDVKSNVQEVWDMLQFSTDAYVTLCAIKLRGMSGIDDVPESFPAGGSLEEQMDWVRNLAAEIVDFCWMCPSAENHASIRQGFEQSRLGNNGARKDVFPYCCLDDLEDDMARCCSWLCKRVWHHLSCADLEELPAPDEDWFCSEECSNDGSYVYCFCHERRGGEMVQCALEDRCKGHEWYHRTCVGGTQEMEGDWYCSDKCALGALEDDPVLNHTKALMWLGLNNIVRRDAVRSGNGPEIISHWKMDLPQFWTYKHPKYFIIAQQLLANVGGFQPEHIRQDLIWNRVGNLKGTPGGNVGLDLINEFLNNDFKEMLKHSRGRYTEKQVSRCAEMGGAFGRQIDRLFTQAGLGQFDSRPSYKKGNFYKEDIRTFCEEYEEDALFDYLPGRDLEGFENFSMDQSIRDPWKMGQKIHTLNVQMDSRKRAGRRQRVQ